MNAMRAWQAYYSSYATRVVLIFGAALVLDVAVSLAVLAWQRRELGRLNAEYRELVARDQMGVQ